MFTSGDEVLRFIEAESVQFVDVRFCDLPGTMQHFTVPAESFDAKVFSDGLMFDGSSIRGFQQIHESDMLLLPDATTAVIDPFRTRKTLNLTFFVHDPLTGEPYTRDPRNIARKAEDYLRGSGVGDTAFFGPEAEFYIFDSARFETSPNAGYYYIDSVEGAWNTGREEPGGNLGYKPRYKGGYFPVPPADHYAGGLLKHAPSLLAFTNPTVNSYHRLVPGFEAPVNLVYSQRNRSACIRIPITGPDPKAKRLEFRVPDPSCNPYLAFAAMLMAGLDGIKNKIEPPEPVDKDLYELPPDEARAITQAPGSLETMLDTLESDPDFLLEGGVFTPALIETWLY